MAYLLRDEMERDNLPPEKWSTLFDVVICAAGKPGFYSSDRPFRKLHPETGQVSWNTVNHFEPGKIYINGSVNVSASLRF
jgi:hypothetical protein